MRLIDADSLYCRIKRHTNPYGKPTLDYESGVKVLDMIKQEPTVDIKTEVAREIFAEIEKFIQSYCNDDNYTIGDMSFEVAVLKNKYTKEGVGE